MLSPQQLFARLEQLGIAQRTVEHPAVFTVEQAKALRGDLPGHHIKNLFLRNKKEEMWLVVALEDRAIDLKRRWQDAQIATPDRRPHVKQVFQCPRDVR